MPFRLSSSTDRLLLATSLMALLGLWPTVATPCEPAALRHDMAALPEPWQQALEELVAASADPSQPWGCSGAQLSLVLGHDQTHAVLIVETGDGRMATRPVHVPADVVPLGKALLAQPAFAAATDVPAAAEAPAEPSGQSQTAAAGIGAGGASAGLPLSWEAPPDSAEPVDEQPRAYFDVMATTRYLGATNGLAAGGALRCTVPFVPWAVGIWARYDGVVHEFDEWNLEEPFVGALAIGAVGSYRLVDEPVRLEMGLTGSLVLVSISGEVPDLSQGDEIEPDESSLDGRLGSELRLAVPLSNSWHALAVIDAEVAPGAAIDPDSRVLHDRLPPMPAYTFGASIGAEVTVR